VGPLHDADRSEHEGAVVLKDVREGVSLRTDLNKITASSSAASSSRKLGAESGAPEPRSV